MDLIAKKDLNDALATDAFKAIKRTHTNAFIKCKQIWHGCTRPKGSEAIVELLGHQLRYPVETRWSTYHKCINGLVKEETKNPGMLAKLLVATATDKKCATSFTDHEIEYITEYGKMTAPLATGIDALQGDKNSFYGDLLPTLLAVRAELEEQFGLRILGKLAKILVKSLVEKRFVHEFQLGEKAKMAICASMSHPAYKSKWGTIEESDKAMVIFKREYERISADLTENDEVRVVEDSTQSKNSFIRLRPTAMTAEASEISRYLLSERVDLEMLNGYPIIREMFFMYNTQLPSSATVERMFNFAGILDDPKRGRILPVNFEKNVVLKANNVFGRKGK